jgi:polyribonucleotide nucleotidyltransferase
MFNNFRVFETDVAGRRLVIEIGKMAQLAGASCLARYGETVILVTAVVSAKPRDGIDFFPLSVDFEEKLYSVGKIPGSFLRREGRPSEKAVLASRVIDRALRPLFSDAIRYDVSVVCTCLSVDENCSPEITAMIGASISLSISDIPWNGPISGVSVGLIDGKFIMNPNASECEASSLALTVASTSEKIVMIAAGAKEVPEDVMFKAIIEGDRFNKKIIEFIQDIKNDIGKPKKNLEISEEIDEEVSLYVEKNWSDRLESILFCQNKIERDNFLHKIYEEVITKVSEIFPEKTFDVDKFLYKMQKKIIRKNLFGNKRTDGRGMDEVRPLAAEVGILPRVHGSGMFTRGETQVLTSVTLGSMRDNQLIDDISAEEDKRYIHHYNFPSFSVGETRPSRGPGRREIGHGALAECALESVIPSIEQFPYTIRLVSEVLSSCGSTSQAAVCGSTLALMDAGVPISTPVAGISCGLVSNEDRWLTFVDIQDIEDFFGDMDFKVAGTKKGITAVQMDIKIDGLLPEIIKEALEKTRTARIEILDEVMLKAISNPRKELSKYAPKVLITSIPVDKIREVIGSGGKVVQSLTAEYNVKIDIKDDGKIFVMSPKIEDCHAAVDAINRIIKEIEPGDIFRGKVTRIMDFGAFIEFAPGREGLCHVSKLSEKRVERVTDAVKIGDMLTVRVTEIDSRNRINLRCISPLDAASKR